MSCEIQIEVAAILYEAVKNERFWPDKEKRASIFFTCAVEDVKVNATFGHLYFPVLCEKIC